MCYTRSRRSSGMSKRGSGGSGRQEGRTGGRDANTDANPTNAPSASDESAQGATGKCPNKVQGSRPRVSITSFTVKLNMNIFVGNFRSDGLLNFSAFYI